MASYVYNIFGDVVDEAYDILSVDGDSNTFPGLSRVNFNKFANRFNKEFIDSVRLRTQEGTYPFITVADDTISVVASSGATTITLTLGTSFPASGLCLVDSIPMTFTRSGAVLTVPTLTREYAAGTVVQLAYAVPTDFWRGQEMFVGTSPYKYARRGDTVGVPASSYVLYGDFFALPEATSGAGEGVFHYYKKPTATLTSTDTMDIMEMWDSYIIFKLVAHGHNVMYDNERSQQYEVMAEQVKRKARSHFARMNGSILNAFIPGF